MAQSSGFALRLVLCGLTSVTYVFGDCTKEYSDRCSNHNQELAISRRETWLATVSSHFPIARLVHHWFDRQRELPRFHMGFPEDQRFQRESPLHSRATLASGLRDPSNEYTWIYRMLIETQLLNEKLLKSPPPMLRLSSQAVSSFYFTELVGVQAFLNVQLRHSHVERFPWPLFPVSQQKRCFHVSHGQNKTARGNQLQNNRSTVHEQRGDLRFSISHQIQHVRIFEPLQGAPTFDLMSAVIRHPQSEHRTWW